ncbi:MAG: peptide chain release factor N(5)-glutamine methyltransferase [Pseudomonadota bacterium]
MNVQQAVELATAKFSQISDSANLDARIIATYVCNIDQTTLIAHPKLELSTEQKILFDHALKRRTQGEPIAYITGSKEFWSLDLNVNEHVLIPRPETELLVERTLDAISNIKTPRVLDLGTGSGAIAIAIAKERPNCHVTATDASTPALELAKQNAHSNDVTVKFIKSDWFKNLTDGNYDVVVSNPPYIAKNDPELNKFVSEYEPNNAIISDDDGLRDLAKIIGHAAAFLSNSGALVVEHGYQQANNVQKLFANENFCNIKSYSDLAGHLRCTCGIHKGV